MDFEEKIDALRMNLELASHDIESLCVSIDGLVKATDNLFMTVNSQQDDLQTLKKISGDLVKIADGHDRRIAALECRA